MRKWEKLGTYAIRCAPWQISVAYVDGCSMFVIWKDGIKDPVAYKSDLDEARAWIAEQERA